MSREGLRTIISIGLKVQPGYVKTILSKTHVHDMLVDDITSRIMGDEASETVILKPSLTGHSCRLVAASGISTSPIRPPIWHRQIMPDHRCRLCTVNDHGALIDHIAEELWESRRRGSPDDWPWAEAGGYWTTIYRELAATAVQSLR